MRGSTEPHNGREFNSFGLSNETCRHNVSKLCRAERSEGTGSARPDDNADATCVLSRCRRRNERIVVARAAAAVRCMVSR
jgi:hypothetical protein